jgi:hypothetical protein
MYTETGNIFFFWQAKTFKIYGAKLSALKKVDHYLHRLWLEICYPGEGVREEPKCDSAAVIP